MPRLSWLTLVLRPLGAVTRLSWRLSWRLSAACRGWRRRLPPFFVGLGEPAKDKAVVVVMTPLPSTCQAVLESVRTFSGPMPVRLDESGCFPLAVLAEKRAKE